METKTLTHEVYFAVTPEEIFEGMVDPTKHSEFTGAPAKIEPKQGGKFTLYNGQLTGTFVEIQTNQRLVQEWRAANWPAGHFSQLTFSPLAEGRHTQLSMVHSGVPAERFEEINHGWRDYYWNKMAAYFREKKVAVVRRFMEEFKNKANLDIVDELFTPDFVLHLPGSGPLVGPSAQKAVGKAVFDAFSKVHVTVIDTIVEGDRVVERHRAEAVHTGEFNGIPATGRQVYWTENHIYRLVKGKVAETWSEVSFHDLMAQVASAQKKSAGREG